MQHTARGFGVGEHALSLLWITLQYTATHCNTLQRTVTHCTALPGASATLDSVSGTLAHFSSYAVIATKKGPAVLIPEPDIKDQGDIPRGYV